MERLNKKTWARTKRDVCLKPWDERNQTSSKLEKQITYELVMKELAGRNLVHRDDTDSDNDEEDNVDDNICDDAHDKNCKNDADNNMAGEAEPAVPIVSVARLPHSHPASPVGPNSAATTQTPSSIVGGLLRNVASWWTPSKLPSHFAMYGAPHFPPEGAELPLPEEEVVEQVEPAIEEEEAEQVEPAIEEEEAEQECLPESNKRRKYDRQVITITTKQGYVVHGVPNNFTLVAKNTYAKLENKAKAYDRLIVVCHSARRFCWNEHACTLLAQGMIQIPSVSFFGFEQCVPCIIAALLAAAHIDFVADHIAECCPSQQTLQDIIVAGAGSTLLWLQEKLGNTDAVFLSCDKGHRKGVDHFAKILSWWDKEEDRVRSTLLDIDGAGSTSKECANAIKNSLCKMMPAFARLAVFVGITTDSGGGGVLESLATEMEQVGIGQTEYFAVAGCALHGLQLGFSNGIKAAFGEGGLGKRTLLQLLHSCYDLQSCLDRTEYALLWELTTQCPPPDMMSAAVLTRWWYVNTAAKHLEKHWDEWNEFASSLLASTKADTKLGQIASSILSLMVEDLIQADLQFVIAFSNAFFERHFKWLQAHDDIAKDFGYRSRDMPLRYFIITQEINDLKDNWRTNKHFDDFRHTLASLELQSGAATPRFVPCTEKAQGDDNSTKSTRASSISNDAAIDRVDAFFLHCAHSYEKHFKRWVDQEQLLSYALASSDRQIAYALAKWVVEGGLPPAGTTFQSSTHGGIEVDVCAFIARVTKNVNREKLACAPLIQKNRAGLEEIARQGSAFSIWTSEGIASIEFLRDYIKSFVLPHAHTTHRVEAAIREASHCSSTSGRSEEIRSAFALQRSVAHGDVHRQCQLDASRRVLRGNQHIGPGLLGERELISKQAKLKRANQGGATAIQQPEHVHVRGCFRAIVLLNNATSRYERIKDAPAQLKKKLHDIYKKKDDKVSTQRIKEKVEKVALTMHKHREPNKIQRQTGIDLTAQAAGVIKISSLRKNMYIPFLVKELEARSVEVPANANVTILLNLLKTCVTGEHLEPITDFWSVVNTE